MSTDKPFNPKKLWDTREDRRRIVYEPDAGTRVRVHPGHYNKPVQLEIETIVVHFLDGKAEQLTFVGYIVGQDGHVTDEKYVDYANINNIPAPFDTLLIAP